MWLEHDSPLLFYVGWSAKVGFGLYSNKKYKQHAKNVADALIMVLSPVLTSLPHSARNISVGCFECCGL